MPVLRNSQELWEDTSHRCSDARFQSGKAVWDAAESWLAACGGGWSLRWFRRGAGENRTRGGGFADLCLTTWLRRRGRINQTADDNLEKGARSGPNLDRASAFVSLPLVTALHREILPLRPLSLEEEEHATRNSGHDDAKPGQVFSLMR